MRGVGRAVVALDADLLVRARRERPLGRRAEIAFGVGPSLGDEAIGALALYASEIDSYSSDHLYLLESVSRLASTGI